jgi:Cytochrome P460
VKARAMIVALGCVGIAASGRSSIGSLPAHLSGYRNWQAGDVHAVSTPLDGLCIPLPEKELAQRREELRRAHGPHAERFLRVYANPIASKAAPDGERAAFPEGSIIAKEKLADPNSSSAEAVAFMIKRAPGTFPQSSDWEFRYYPESRGADFSGCIECHRAGASKDYVFSRLRRAAQQ